MTPRRALGLLVGLAWLAAPLAALAQAPMVTFTAQAIEASSPKTSPRSDVDVGDIKQTLGFTQYRLLGTVSSSPVKIDQMWSASLTSAGLVLEVTPKAVDGGAIAVEVRLLREGRELVKSRLSISPGGKVAVGGPQIPNGRIIVVLSGR
jgi:hypothetical protein